MNDLSTAYREWGQRETWRPPKERGCRKYLFDSLNAARRGICRLWAQRSGPGLEAGSSFNERAMSFAMKRKNSSQAI